MYAAILFALATSAVMAAPIAERDAKPSGWATGYLENYDTYHTRYIALSCYTQHNTTFFDDCCHPLLAVETVEEHRPAYCTPNATAISSASAYESTAAAATTTAVEDNEAASEYSVADPTSTSQWTAPTQSAAAQESNDNNDNSNNSPSGDMKYGGHATFFYQNGNPGACGTVHSDSDRVIAIDSNGYWPDYATNNNSPYCGKWINIKNTNNGKTVSAMVADVCPTCDNNNSLDLSTGAFNAIADEADGSVPIEWSWA